MPNQRIDQLSPPYPAAVQKEFDVIMPAGVPPLNIFRTVAQNPRVLQRMVRGGLLDKGSISLADRELVILRACARCDAEYEWGVHVAGFSAKTGFSQQQIANTRNETVNPELWNQQQQLLIELVDELHDTCQLSDALWEQLENHYQPDQLVELVMLAGLYHAVSFIVNSFRIEKEAFAPSFPSQ